MEDLIRKRILESTYVKQSSLSLVAEIAALARKMVECYKKGGKVVLFGNGGSAADAQHIAGELVSRFYLDRPMLDAVALTTNSSVMTAIGNDYGFEDIFARQLENLIGENDVVIGISTSGKSLNVIKALKMARGRKIFTAGMCGKKPDAMSDCCDLIISVPSEDTPRIQEVHITIGHIICELVEKELFQGGL